MIFLGKSVYTTLPAILANIAPVVMKRVNFLNYPLDFNKSLGNERVLGSNKTFRGLFFGVLFAMIVMNIQYLVYRFTGFDFTVYSYEEVNYQFLGFLMGLGVIVGDLVKSFVKRRLKIDPGKSFIPWDQIDCVLGGLLLGRIAWDFPISYGILIIVVTFFMHILARYIGYFLGLCEKW